MVAARWDDQWVGTGLTAILRHESPREIPRISLPVVRDLLVRQDILPMSRLDGLINEIAEGLVNVGNDKAIWKRWDPQAGFTVPFYFSFSNRYREVTNRLLGSAFPTFSLQGIESNLMNTVFGDGRGERHNAELGSLDEPWDGLAELRFGFLGDDPRHYPTMGDEPYSGSWDSSFVVVAAPICVHLSPESSLTTNSLRLVAKASPSLDGSEISFGAVVDYPTGPTKRHSGKPRSKSVDEANLEWTLKLEGGPRPTRARAFLRYRGQLLDRMQLWGPGIGLTRTRLAAHALYDPDFAKIEKMLNGTENERRFEEGVAWLFHFLGFSVIHYGLDGWDSPDLLAFWSSPSRAIIVECTLKEINLKFKLSKLKARQAGLQSQTGIRFHPVLVTAFPSSGISRTEMEDSAKDEIAVVCMPEVFGELIDLAEAGTEVHEVLEYLRNKIPASTGMEGLSWM